ncbi:hypothetical protein [Neorhodopirellula pilleata]|uniref:Uncharacterized protein n=1 Tax=Neorhodopirellula pilleata TaxID=2714738 RepID=A0A5C5ZZC9_9BACT|nr:hypothetical protein [Neorhodopirellula pilleata]TWT92485.1 hypothetical protein Pla100_45030 [Neorhodopirellula pilleata]
MMNRHYPTAIGLLALMTLTGCASITDSCYEKTQTVRAFKEYVKCGNPECSSYPHDYKCGWIDGFYEVATGGECCPPAVAPARYYKPEQILKHCDKKRHAYYSGWQDGASRASQFPDTHYLRIYETCECPFPRCDKPCGDSACGPCGVSFVGMSASDDLIEAMPIEHSYSEEMFQNEAALPLPIEDEVGVQSSSNRMAPTVPEPAAEDKVQSIPVPPTAEVEETVPVDEAPKAIEPMPAPAEIAPQAIPAPKPDASTFFPMPAELPPGSFSRTDDEDFSADFTDGFSLNPVVPTTATPVAKDSGESFKGKTVGFVRLAEPLQNTSSLVSGSVAKDPTHVSPVAIVEAEGSSFKMLETESTTKPAR